MANLGTKTFDTKGQYINIANEMNITLTPDTTYTIQIQNPAYIRDGEEGKGFYIDNSKPFDYTNGGENLYINTLNSYAVVNIAE